MPTLKLPILRLIIVTLMIVPLAVYMFGELGRHEPWSFQVMIIALGLSPLVAAFGQRWMQYAIRGGWFAGLCWSLLGIYMSNDLALPLWWAGCFAGALLVAGWVPAGDGTRFSAVAFKKTLSTSLVFGLADFTTLAFIPFIILSADRSPDWLLVGICSASAVGLCAALVGLYRMRVWGLFLCLTMNLVVVGWLLLGVVDFPDEIAFMLCTTAAIQLLLPTPILWTIFRNRKRQIAV